ncbi:hypothetical protein [Alteromonas naphthalenivorans]|uniref:Uncharacterized protein n=1 Tax=Alteromonas naphthalenivorans TaxID=715451 RepID=F5Z7E8_ALTNA|nr:hypothetical protein [Alteromonas naphthalenivorans]AEF02991.1 hypothetical protein ambt_07290 [Alteromonas naphthalenivorans]
MQISNNTPVYQPIVNDKLEKNHQTAEAEAETETSNCKKKEAEESAIAEANKVNGNNQTEPSEIKQSISVKV